MIFTTALVAALASAASVSAGAIRKARTNNDIIPPTETDFLVVSGQEVIDQTLTFHVGQVPSGPCTLFGKFAAGTPIESSDGNGANDRLNIFNQDGSNIGSFPGLQLDAESRVAVNTLVVINSVTCADTLSFRFSLANDAGSKDVNDLAFSVADVGAGNGFFVKAGDQTPLPTFP